MKFLLPALVALLLAAGCTTVKTTRVFNGVRVDGGRTPVATLSVENSGWFLFTCIPLASGDPNLVNECACRCFQNTVTLENNMQVLERELARQKVHEVANLTSHYEDEKYLIFLLSRRAYHTSAVLLAPDKPQTESKKSK